MDPLIHLLTQTQRSQLDNVQRSSEHLRTQQDKELKRKRARAGEVDLSDFSGDIANDMGEDLLGSMDPDLFGRSSGAEAFKKSWEEALEDDSESEGEQQEEQQPSDELTEEAGEDSGGEDGVGPVPVDPPASLELQEHRDGRWEPVEEPSTEDPPLEAPEPADSREESEGPDVAEVGASERPLPSDGEWQSLLNHGVGFLIAEEPAAASEEEPVSELDPASLEPVAPQLANVLGRLIVGDPHGYSYRRLQHLLARFGLGVLKRCADEGVKVHLLPRGERLSSHPTVASYFAEPDLVGALYVPSKRWCFVEEECLLEMPPHFHPVLYTFAHAFDHAMGDDGFASIKSAAVQASFLACQQGLDGHSFADSLARQSPAHYFAQAVESYLSENDSQEPLWTRDDLYDFDRSIYEYVEYLLKRVNGVR
ncbi:MAG: hypothetical protein HY319_18640 [Armatimonadetes bacterium]|nr:hypothetical protein [Armatimonadota bacterium]